jgi:hypothetical protein
MRWRPSWPKTVPPDGDFHTLRDGGWMAAPACMRAFSQAKLGLGICRGVARARNRVARMATNTHIGSPPRGKPIPEAASNTTGPTATLSIDGTSMGTSFRRIARRQGGRVGLSATCSMDAN